MFPRNFWYVAAWDWEVRRQELMQRTICNEPIVFWRREIGGRAIEIGNRAREAGLVVAGLCRSPFLVGPAAPRPLSRLMDDFRASIDMAAGLGTPVLTIVVGGVDLRSAGVPRRGLRATGLRRVPARGHLRKVDEAVAETLTVECGHRDEG